MTDKLKGGTFAWHRRQAIHTHNGLRGKCRMAQLFLFEVINSSSTTHEARATAAAISPLIEALLVNLAVRDDERLNKYLNHQLALKGNRK